MKKCSMEGHKIPLIDFFIFVDRYFGIIKDIVF